MKKIHYTDSYLLKPYHPVTIHVAGAGGTGSQVITNLARMNVALQALGHPGLHVTVFDPDIITEANIGLGEIVLKGITQMKIGLGFEGGIAVVILAIILDRITQGMAGRKNKN